MSRIGERLIRQRGPRRQKDYGNLTDMQTGNHDQDDQDTNDVCNDVEERVGAKLKFSLRATTTHRLAPALGEEAALSAGFFAGFVVLAVSRPNSIVSFCFENSCEVAKPARVIIALTCS